MTEIMTSPRSESAVDAPPPAAGARVPALDGVRGLAIMLVVFHHALSSNADESGGRLRRVISNAAHEGYLGVDLFFALSGYLITSILLRTRGTPGYFKNFMMRRVLRIMPLYYLFIFVFFAVLPRLFPREPELTKLPSQWLWYVTYLPNVKIFLQGNWDALWTEHTWSLAIEEQFYLLWPGVVLLLSRRALIVACSAGALLSLALRALIVLHGGGRAAAFVLMPAHMDGLLFGAIVAAIEAGGSLAPYRRTFALTAVLAFLFLVMLPRLGLGYDLTHFAAAVTVWSALFAAVIGFLVASSPRSLVAKALTIAPLRSLGTYSYGIYLIHQPLFRVMRPAVHALHVSPWLKGMLMLGGVGGLSLVLAALTYHGFEVHFLRLKRWFEPKRV